MLLSGRGTEKRRSIELSGRELSRLRAELFLGVRTRSHGALECFGLQTRRDNRVALGVEAGGADRNPELAIPILSDQKRRDTFSRHNSLSW